MMTDADEVMGTQEAARRLGVSVRTVQLWVEKGELVAWKTSGGHRRISRKSVEETIKKRGKPAVNEISETVRVLIVEDDVTMQSYYRALFDIASPGAELTLVENSYTALIELGRKQPDLMLVDVDLPDINGVELLRSIESTVMDSGVQVAVVTGLDDDQLSKYGEVSSDIPVYTKPLSIDSLQVMLKRVSRQVESA